METWRYRNYIATYSPRIVLVANATRRTIARDTVVLPSCRAGVALVVIITIIIIGEYKLLRDFVAAGIPDTRLYV